jgi:RNA polymerase sigma factor (sigma-70 family)
VNTGLEKRELFERFYKSNYEKFFNFALRYVDDEEVCRDIISMAFEYAWRKLSADDFDNWTKILLSYIHYKCIDVLRHEIVKSQYVKAKLLMAQHEDASDWLERNERVEMVKKYLDELPPKTRLILRECMVNNRKYKEVAEELELTVHAIRKHIVKGLKILREKVNSSK